MQQKINQLKQDGYEIYYNNSGDPFMYRSGIKHLSASLGDGVARKSMMNGDILEIISDKVALYEEGEIKKLEKGGKLQLIPLIYSK